MHLTEATQAKERKTSPETTIFDACIVGGLALNALNCACSELI